MVLHFVSGQEVSKETCVILKINIENIEVWERTMFNTVPKLLCILSADKRKAKRLVSY